MREREERGKEMDVAMRELMVITDDENGVRK